jgi:hypothetical protein
MDFSGLPDDFTYGSVLQAEQADPTGMLSGNAQLSKLMAAASAARAASHEARRIAG